MIYTMTDLEDTLVALHLAVLAGPGLARRSSRRPSELQTSSSGA